MLLFGKKKDEPAPLSPAPNAAAAPAKQVSAEDFFGDIDKKPKMQEDKDEYKPKAVVPEEVKPDLEAPVVEGLREAPLPAPVSTIKDVSTSGIDTEILPDKTLIPPPVPFEIDEPEEKKPSSSDDFFADIDRKAKKLKEANKLVIEPPSTESLRETAPPPPPSTLKDVDTEEVTDEVLPEKQFDDLYHGDMTQADPDEEEVAALAFKHEKEQREEDGSLEYSNETYEGIDINNSAPVEVEKIEEE